MFLLIIYLYRAKNVLAMNGLFRLIVWRRFVGKYFFLRRNYYDDGFVSPLNE